jgi:SAM-dependent methyltransferase
VLELLELQAGEHILDVGAGQGALAPAIAQAGARYTGVDASEKMVQFARQHHGAKGSFLVGDARRLSEVPGVRHDAFDAVVFLLSIQDMDPLREVVASAAWALKPGGRMVLLLTHPCFRVPRQSGWGWDEGRQLTYRRVDRYLTPLAVPMKAYPGRARGVTWSYHRPLQEYVNALADCGLMVDRLREVPTYKVITSGPQAEAQNLAHREIPLFLGIRARKVER